jgi:hypothetical protein
MEYCIFLVRYELGFENFCGKAAALPIQDNEMVVRCDSGGILALYSLVVNDFFLGVRVGC